MLRMALIASCSAVGVHAQLVFQDSFNYPAGQPLGSQSSWVSSGSGNEILINPGNLATAGMQNPVGNSIALAGPGKSAFTTFAAQTSDTYYSFALNVVSLGTMTTAGDYFAGFTDGGAGQGCTLWLRRDSVNPNAFDFGLSVRDSSSVQWNSNGSGWAIGQYHFLGLYDFGVNFDGTADVADAWINGDMSATYGKPTPGVGPHYRLHSRLIYRNSAAFSLGRGREAKPPHLWLMSFALEKHGRTLRLSLNLA